MPKILAPNIEQSLVQEAKKGSPAAFAQLYDAYIKQIYDFIYYKTMNRAAAEDICSDVFLRAWKNISSLQGENFSGWLYSIARNAVTDYYRSAATTLNIEDCWDLPDNSNLLEDVDATLKIVKIRRAMQALKPADREIIMLRLWLDLPFKEIARQLDKQEGAVKMSFGRAIGRLREALPLPLLMLLINFR